MLYHRGAGFPISHCAAVALCESEQLVVYTPSFLLLPVGACSSIFFTKIDFCVCVCAGSEIPSCQDRGFFFLFNRKRLGASFAVWVYFMQVKRRDVTHL